MAVDVGVTQEQTHRGRTVILQDKAETLTNQVESFVPGGWGQRPVRPTNHRLGEPIKWRELTERHALRADVAATEHVLRVSTMSVTWSPWMVIVSPQVASHRGQTRSAMVTPCQGGGSRKRTMYEKVALESMCAYPAMTGLQKESRVNFRSIVSVAAATAWPRRWWLPQAAEFTKSTKKTPARGSLSLDMGPSVLPS